MKRRRRRSLIIDTLNVNTRLRDFYSICITTTAEDSFLFLFALFSLTPMQFIVIVVILWDKKTAHFAVGFGGGRKELKNIRGREWELNWRKWVICMRIKYFFDKYKNGGNYLIIAFWCWQWRWRRLCWRRWIENWNVSCSCYCFIIR